MKHERWTAERYRREMGLSKGVVVPSKATVRKRIGEMNKTEAAYSAWLAEQQHAGAILWHKFEALKLRLADNTFYTPDFMVLAADSRLELHEVKGFWQDDARVKIKVAAEQYPGHRFRAIKARRKKDGGGWGIEEFPS